MCEHKQTAAICIIQFCESLHVSSCDQFASYEHFVLLWYPSIISYHSNKQCMCLVENWL
jgi:hypothetical protein